MYFLRLLLLLSIPISLTLISCNGSVPAADENTLARVGNEYLTLEDARTAIPDFLLEQDSVGALSQYRDSWIQRKVLVQEANRLGLPHQKEVQKKLQKAREEVLREALRDVVIGSRQDEIQVTDEEARSFYQSNKEQFALNEDFVQFRHLRARTLQEARAAKQDLLRGIPWPEVAREYDIDPGAALKTSDQYWPISMALSEIGIMNRYLNIIGQNEISPIQRVNGVYHFVQLTESRSEGELPNLDWLITKIQDWMLLDKQRRNFSSYVKNLYLKAESNNDIETYNVLPTNINLNTTFEDTLKSTSTDE